MNRSIVLLVLCFMSLLCGQAQQIRMISKSDPSRILMLRMDKDVTVLTFERDKIKGMASVDSLGRMYIEGRSIDLADIMTISGIVMRNSKEKVYGTGMTIIAGLVLPVSAYYVLGGIAWGFASWIFVGAAVMAFDLILAYSGSSLMGIFPRRFSTMNWQVQPVVRDAPPPLPLPSSRH